MPTRPRRPRGTFDGTLATLLGGTFVSGLTAHDDRAPLRIGKQVWSRHDLALKLGVTNVQAARRLSQAVAEVGATSVADLYRRSSPYTFAGVKRLGETTMYVLWRLFESAGLDPDAWADAGDTEQALVSFRSLKLREQKAEARTTADAKTRAWKSQRSAHEAKVAAVLR